ncbi:hypothetical protein Syun_016835 [Stephania yunnanensis]|uniref:Uncharacterized protein n=1 Tax=Stephania yunnanensis TaxID=152371 RepID=A0AAP0J5X5_9MAGN
MVPYWGRTVKLCFHLVEDPELVPDERVEEYYIHGKKGRRTDMNNEHSNDTAAGLSYCFSETSNDDRRGDGGQFVTVGVDPSSSSRPGKEKIDVSSEQFDDSPHSFCMLNGDKGTSGEYRDGSSAREKRQRRGSGGGAVVGNADGRWGFGWRSSGRRGSNGDSGRDDRRR